MYWIKKYDEYCLKFRLRPSTQLLWRWILRRTNGDNNQEIEIDLRKFNDWVGKKRGKPFDRKTIKEAIAQLDNETEGLVVIYQQISWYYFKLIVRPLSYLTIDKTPKTGTTPKLDNVKPMFDAEAKKKLFQQQQRKISDLKKLFDSIDVRFDGDALKQIWRLAGKSIERINESIQLMLYRNGHTKIGNPPGFIVDALRYGWGKGINLYYEPELPQFKSRMEIPTFVDNLCRVVQT